MRPVALSKVLTSSAHTSKPKLSDSSSHSNMLITSPNTQITLAYHFSSTKESTALYIQANIGKLNFLNGYAPKDSSNLNQNHHILSSTTSTINGYASSSSSTTCSTQEVKTPSKKNLKIPFATDSMSNSLDQHNGSSKWEFTNTMIPPTPLISTAMSCLNNTLQRYDPDSEFPQRETPFPPNYIFSKDNRPVNINNKALIQKQEARLPFRSAVCTLLYLAYNTRADILFAVCKLAKACIYPDAIDYRALTWLIGYLRRRPNYAIKFYPESTSNPIYEICHHHRIPCSNLTVFSDTSWQDCPDTGRSTVGYMIFHNGALIEANSTMPTHIAMSTSEAKYMAACSASMATAHIHMLLYDMIYLGTKQWRESAQRLPTIPSILMIDNEATVQIAKNGKLTQKACHIERRFHFVRKGQQDGSHQLHWIPCESQLADILTKTQVSSMIDPHLTKIFASHTSFSPNFSITFCGDLIQEGC